ncbi:TraB/GumN family protein [Paraclostridium sordellii]|uniref:TraB/GumN family protein n=1 Tax=Paraclostridium sordellii TaxID=1505 RepID=UPI00189BDD06|nr:TraB/GumN family protein [Paeniclostridium sordellii]
MKSSTKKNFLKWIGLVILMIVVTSIIENISSPKAKGVYFKATKGNSCVYLVGTVPYIDKHINFLSGNLTKVLYNTDVLLVNENFYTSKNNYYSKNHQLKYYLNKEEEKIFNALLSYFNLNYKDISNLTPNEFLELIDRLLAYKAGLTENKFDSYLTNIYKKDKKEIVTLKNSNSNKLCINEFKNLINSFNSNFMDEQVDFSKKVMRAFIDGNVKFFKEASYKFDNLENTKLNRMTSDQIDSLISSNKTYAVAVKVYLLFGKNGIINNLKSKGYTITYIK